MSIIRVILLIYSTKVSIIRFLKFCLIFFLIKFIIKWRYTYLPESGAERQKGRIQRRIAPFILTAGIDLKKLHVDKPT